MATEPALLRLEGVTKRFPGVAALQGVTLEVRAGEVHGLLGENGAGKSTLLKIVSGAQRPDAGRILWRGEPVTLASPHAAQRLGIVTIHQEFTLVPALTVAENVFIGREPVRATGLLDWPRLRRDTAAIIRRIGLALDPMTPVRDLSVAEQQMVEIARALSMESRLIIMDEPTSALSQAEVERLLGIMEALRRDGIGVVFVTHRLDEARRICDRITMLRDGQLVTTRQASEIALDDIIRAMVGRSAEQLYRRPETRHAPGEVRLVARDLATPRAGRGTALHGVSIQVRAGEILGIAGLVGAGRTEFARAVFGADGLLSGTVEIDGRPVRLRSPRDAIRAGIGLMPEDRKQQALFLSQAVRRNFSIAALAQFLRLGLFVREGAEAQALDGYRRALSIRMSGAEQAVVNLSGGNQQKVVLARWLALKPRVLIVDEPTRGVDVAAKAEVHELLDGLARQGVAVIAISSELPEVLAISDRIVTMREGRITGELPAAEATQERLMTLMTLKAAA